MARRTRTFLITAVAAAAALIPAAGASAGTLDQQQTISNFGGLQVDSSNSKAQTFTAGITGQLDQVDLALSGMSVTTPLTVQIRDGSATAPGDTVLASASVPTTAVTSSESFVPITFTSSASVTAGTQYSIVALNGSVPISGWFWYSGQAAPDSAYVGGKLYGVMNGTGTGPWAEGNPQADLVQDPSCRSAPGPWRRERYLPDRRARRGAEEVQEKALEEGEEEVQEEGEEEAGLRRSLSTSRFGRKAALSIRASPKDCIGGPIRSSLPPPEDSRDRSALLAGNRLRPERKWLRGTGRHSLLAPRPRASRHAAQRARR